MEFKSWLLPMAVILLFLAGRWWYFRPSVHSGETAPPIEGTLLDGTPFQLSQLQDTYVLLDFWGSWCGPCRKANPQLVDLYRKVKAQNLPLEIVSIGIETDANRWKQAIAADGLAWKYHLSTIQRFNDPIAQAYGVRQIPTTFLLSRKHEILAVNPQIDRIIADYLSK